MDLPYAEPYKIKMIEPLKTSTKNERLKWIKNACYNLFNLKSEQVFIDLLTDSGTGAMSNKQWSALMLGDESYAGASSYENLKNAVKEITGFEYFLPTHQGRAAENVLFSTLVKEGDIIPGNKHFDTTKGHIEYRNANAVDCTIKEAYDTTVYHPFKGNIDLEKLEKVLKENKTEKIPFIIVTLTCNSVGGQPVSLENLKYVRLLSKKYNVPLILDSARFAENAFFIKSREDKFKDKSIKEIVKKIFSYADGMTISSKKDAIVNIGGFIALRDKEIYRKASIYNIIFEGYITYGGLAGRDMEAIAQGLYEGIEYDYLESRIRQVHYLGGLLKKHGIPVQEPFGGHAIFIDAKKFLPEIPKEQFPAQTLATELYIDSGVRSVEIGTLLADRDPVTRKNRFPKLDLIRLAVPRRVYTNNHMDYVAASLLRIFKKSGKDKKGLKIIREAPIMRHFTIELERVK